MYFVLRNKMAYNIPNTRKRRKPSWQIENERLDNEMESANYFSENDDDEMFEEDEDEGLW